jgi:hypothetical protein
MNSFWDRISLSRSSVETKNLTFRNEFQDRLRQVVRRSVARRRHDDARRRLTLQDLNDGLHHRHSLAGACNFTRTC